MREYVIIDAEKMRKRIEEIKLQRKKALEAIKELFKKFGESEAFYSHKDALGRHYSILTKERAILNALLEQSTPLISEISKAYDAGKLDRELSLTFDNPKGRYMSSLKLQI